MATAVESVKDDIIGFIIPFVFVYNTSLTLMVDFEWGEFLWACLRLVLAIWVLASGLGGYDRARLDLPSRAVRIVSGVAMLMPGGLIELDGQSVVEGRSVSVRVDLGGRRLLKKKK